MDRRFPLGVRERNAFVLFCFYKGKEASGFFGGGRMQEKRCFFLQGAHHVPEMYWKKEFELGCVGVS